jgi:ABC-type oligopeptide transport system ATPase subunit
MFSANTHTRKVLAEMLSADAFEALATAVLREADPSYRAIVHVGTNAGGKTVRSPVDGIDIRLPFGSKHLILVQHTITASKGLRKKWLGELDGDLIKAKALADQEFARGAIERATLILSTANDPDESLVRDIHAVSGNRLEVDFWPGSRIADFLDRNPEGQWIRKLHLGSPAVRLSWSQLREVSSLSLQSYLPQVPRSELIERAEAPALLRFAKRAAGTGFVIGESGKGKSTALRAIGDNWHSSGGIVLVLDHEATETASSLDHAVTMCLQKFERDLDGNSGRVALSLVSPEMPLLLIVEDVNRSSNPGALIEKLTVWSTPRAGSAGSRQQSESWRLLCPVWPENVAVIDKRPREAVFQRSIHLEKFELSDAARAIRKRADHAGVKLTDLQCDDLAKALGLDPLLIGLFEDWSSTRGQDAFDSFFASSLGGAAGGGLLASDIAIALDSLLEKMALNQEIQPTWKRIRGWFSEDPDGLSAVRRLVDQARIMRLNGTGADARLVFRHDRVRFELLGRAVVRLIERDEFSAELWSDPYYAELIGRALSSLPISDFEKARRLNPVSIFAALLDESLPEQRRETLVLNAQQWVSSMQFHDDSCEQQRAHALRYLARTDGAFVRTLAEQFPFGFLQLEALVRNGDAKAGAAICLNHDPGVNSAWRDRLISHAVSRHPAFIDDLCRIIGDRTVTRKTLEGALNLAGEIGDPKLCDALAARWGQEGEKSLSSGWLWAVLRCCPPARHPLADTICEVWGKLPTRDEGPEHRNDDDPRWDIAGYTLRFAFARIPEKSAIEYLVHRGRSDKRLGKILTILLAGADHPDAVVFCIEQSANLSRRAHETGGFNIFGGQLERAWSPDNHGRMLGNEARAAAERIWRDASRDRFLRVTAFSIWSKGISSSDGRELAALADDAALADGALRARLSAGDQTAIAELRARLSQTSGWTWWYHARVIGLPSLKEDFLRYIEARAFEPPRKNVVTEADHILSELLMDANDDFAVHTTLAHWDVLKRSPQFICAALYLARPETIELATNAIRESDIAEEVFQHIGMRWGIKTQGRPGVTSLAQLAALEPYYADISKMKFGQLHISDFFDCANKLLALDWRRRVIDPLISRTDPRICPWDKEALFTSLDAEVDRWDTRKRTWFAIDHWFERREAELWERRQLLEVIGEWAASRSNRAATLLLCEALQCFGERKDLKLLDGLGDELTSLEHEAVKNCHYNVRRQSPQIT